MSEAIRRDLHSSLESHSDSTKRRTSGTNGKVSTRDGESRFHRFDDPLLKQNESEMGSLESAEMDDGYGSFLLTTFEGDVCFASETLAKSLGTSQHNLVGLALQSLVNEESGDLISQFLDRSDRSERIGEFAFCFHSSSVTLKMSRRWVQLGNEDFACFSSSRSDDSTDLLDGFEETNQAFFALTENSSDIILVLDNFARVKYANSAFTKLLGIKRQDFKKINILDLIHPDDYQRAKEALIADYANPGQNHQSSYRVRTTEGKWRVFETVATNVVNNPSLHGVVINSRDVTERQSLELALRTLSKCNHVMMHAVDERSLLQEMCNAIVKSDGYALAWVGYADDDPQKSISVAAHAGDNEYVDHLSLSWNEADQFGQGPTGRAVRTGQVQVINDVNSSSMFSPWQKKAKHSSLRSVCVLPFTVPGGRVGVLSIYSNEFDSFDASAVELLEELARDLAYGLGRLIDAHVLEQSELRFRTLTSSAPIGIVEVSLGMITFANNRASEILGLALESLIGRECSYVLQLLNMTDLVSRTREFAPGELPIYNHKVIRPDGEYRHVTISVSRSFQDDSRNFIATISDVTPEVEAKEALVRKAFHDELTGLANRELFLDCLQKEIAHAKRRSPNISVLFLDLDRFKIVNDTLGHEAGDIVLIELGKRFSKMTRADETVARFSGDEFVFLIRGVSDHTEAIHAAERILTELRKPIVYQGRELNMSGSIGIVVPSMESDPQSVVRNADIAMYKAKSSGGNRFEIFNGELYDRLVNRLALEGELRKALALGEFEIYFQPKVDPITALPIGAEGLIRWNHPTRGLVSPGEFIKIAEESGLIIPIGNWVFEQAIRQLAAWDEIDGGPKIQILSVNVSTLQLEDPVIAEVARREIERFQIAPNRIAIEVTESTLMGNSDVTKQSLIDLEQLGVKIGIDDFGTGYSSLSYLHALPVAVVKVDQTFIERLGSIDDSTPIVKAIIEMSHAMGLGVVAEGVSSAELAERIKGMGFDLAQGFHWAPPMAKDEFASWWKAQTLRAQGRKGL